MKKKLFRIVLFGILLFISTKVFVALNAFLMLSTLKDHHKDEFLLTYNWISSSLDGTLSIEDIEFTPYVMKKTFKLKQLSLHYDGYYALLTNLSSLKDGSIEKLKKLTIPSIRSELKGRSVRELLSMQWGSEWFTPIELYACGGRQYLSVEDYRLMGIQEWDTALSIELEESVKGHDLVSMTVDQNELGRIQLQAELPRDRLEMLIKQKNIDELTLFSVDVEHQDAGFFRRLNILCNRDGADKRSLFSANAALAWKNKMYSQGLVMNDSLVELYGRYFMQGGSLSVKASKENGFSLVKFKELLNKDLIKYFDIKLELNDVAFNDAELYVDGSIIYPPVKEPIAEPVPHVDEIKFEPGYKEIKFEFIDQYIGRKIRVYMLNGKEYEGLLASKTEYNLELSQNLPGGVVNYPLMLNEIKTFEVWLNHAP